MGQFEGGYTSAVNSAQSRDLQAQEIQQMLQAIATQQWKQREFEDAKQRNLAARAAGGAALAGMQLPSPPMGGAPMGGPQSPPPGQASVPMRMGPPPAEPEGMGGGTASLFSPPPMDGGSGMPPPPMGDPGIIPPAPPMGWRPSPVATPELGGQPPAPLGAAPGGPDSLAAPPGVPGLTADAPRIPSESMTVKGAIAQLQKQGVPPDRQLDALESMLPAINAQNQAELRAYATEVKAQEAATRAYRATIAQMTEDRRQAQGDRRLDQRDAALEQAAPLVAARTASLEAGGAGGAIEPLTPAAKALAARMSAQGIPLPGSGYSKGGINQRNGILNQMAIDEAGGSPAGATGPAGASKSVATTRSDYKADSGALNALTKDITAIRPYKEMLDKNADIAIDLGKKIMTTNSAYANKTLRWLQQNVGDNPDANEYIAQMRIVQTEAARVLNNPRLVGQLTDNARHEMDDIVNGNMPIKSAERVIRRMQTDGNNRVDAMEAQRERLRSSIAGKPTAAAGATGGAGKPKPTPDDIAWVQAHPEDAQRYRAQFGIDPP